MKEIKKAVRLLKKGKLVILPTETVYGLVCDAANPKAVEKVFTLKKRQKDKALSILITSLAEIEEWAIDIPALAYKLAEQYWPGPLTLILKKATHVPDFITGGKPTIALRMPDHPLTLAILTAFGKAVCAPSANFAGEPAPIARSEVHPKLAKKVSYVVDGGPCKISMASTIIDLTGETPTVLREGIIRYHHRETPKPGQ